MNDAAEETESIEPTTLEEDLLYIQANLQVPKSREGQKGRYKYRNTEDIFKSLKPFLDDRGCLVLMTDDIKLIGEGDLSRFYVKTTATICKGQESVPADGWAREPISHPGMDESQLTGSAASYASKRALGNLFLLDDSMDPDSFIIVTDEEVDMFSDLVVNGEGAKLFLMQLNDSDKYAALHNKAAPKGKKTAFRKEVSDLIMQAVANAQTGAAYIREYLNKEDPDVIAIEQAFDEMTDDEKAMTKRQFTPDEVQQLKALK